MKIGQFRKITLFMLIIAVALSIFSCKKDTLEGNSETTEETTNSQPEENLEFVTVDFRKNDGTSPKGYSIKPETSHIVFIGNPSKIYYDFSIRVEKRATPLYIELQDFNYQANKSTIALDASNVIFTQKVYLIANGNCSIYGGYASDGKSKSSQSWNIGYDNPTNGENGGVGGIGNATVVLNSGGIIVNKDAVLTLVGGNGGSGGSGGSGQGGSSEGIGQSGHGGTGGTGGTGGVGLLVNNEISIENNGTLALIGGKGGTGGEGGRGGNNQDTGVFDRADHGGNGGNGGNGGTGGYAIQILTTEDKVKVEGNRITLIGGNGGNGGNGNKGGDSCKNEFQTSSGGTPGKGGNGGTGGNGGLAAQGFFADADMQNGSGGLGGSKGDPGYNPSIGYGQSGTDGSNGIKP